jgi:flagellar basal-body rod modification protein FlgD
MATAVAIFQHQLTAGRALSPMDSSSPTSGSNGTSGTSGSTGSDSGSATISANDFLTLLVTEMQNQDPTADTDPNEYINQLVQVNSLEQLIDINQTLGGALGSSSSDPTTGSSDPPTQAAGTAANPGHSSAQSSLGTNLASGPGASANPDLSIGAMQSASAAAKQGSRSALAAAAHSLHGPGGNLSIPAANASAQRVGHALDGRVRASTTRTQ